MTFTLILTRHAKSAWDTNSPSDHARPLSKRGRQSAAALGVWLKETDLVPDQVISSSAQRTRETYDLMELNRPALFVERLYHASADVMFQVLKEATQPRTLILGHNPGILAFAHALVGDPPHHPRFDDYPTGATLVVDFDIHDWGDLKWRMGRARDFIVPRELVAS